MSNDEIYFRMSVHMTVLQDVGCSHEIGGNTYFLFY